MTQKKSVNYKLSKEFAREKWGRFMASNILKNNRFGGPTHFDRRVATFESKARVTRERHLAEKQTKNSLFLHFCTWQLWFQKSIFSLSEYLKNLGKIAFIKSGGHLMRLTIHQKILHTLSFPMSHLAKISVAYYQRKG